MNKLIINILLLLLSIRVFSFEIPDTIYFAGAQVPLEFLDTKERISKTIYSFAYDRKGKINYLLSLKDKYLPASENIFNNQKVHKDFIYIMLAESEFNDRARSTAGAAGLWQFTRPTALSYGLSVTNEYDERFDFRKSTKAAAKFIKDLYFSRTCDKDPFLVLACYNNGEKNVSNTKKAQGAESFFEMVSNRETSKYVIKVIAYKEIFSNPEKYGFSPENISRQYKYERFNLSLGHKNLKYKDLASFLDISYREFYILNPHLEHKSYKLGGKISKYGNLDIYIPYANKSKLKDSLQAYGYLQDAGEIIYGKKIIKDSINITDEYILHVVNENTLAEIAFKYGINWTKIADDNNLKITTLPSGIKIAKIYKGQKLKIYSDNERN